MDSPIFQEDEFGGSTELPDLFLLSVYYKTQWNDLNFDFKKHRMVVVLEEEATTFPLLGPIQSFQ